MQTYLAVFRSRAQTLDFVARLLAAGIPASAVSTPKEARVGCGLSAKIGAFDLIGAKRALACGHYGAFAGFFRVETRNGRTFVYPA